MSANNSGPSHYKDKTIQPWDFIIALNLNYLEGNVVKYVCRWRQKNGIDDLNKAKHYLEKLIEVESKKPKSKTKREKTVAKADEQQAKRSRKRASPKDQGDAVRGLRGTWAI